MEPARRARGEATTNPRLGLRKACDAHRLSRLDAAITRDGQDDFVIVAAAENAAQRSIAEDRPRPRRPTAVAEQNRLQEDRYGVFSVNVLFMFPHR